MKKTIWSLENIRGTHDFYTELNLLSIVSSIILWKEHNEGPTILHCDSLTKKLFQHLDIIYLWDKVYTDVIDSPTNIDKTSFWASSKVRVLAAQTEPVRIIDNDFLAYSRLDNLDEGLVTFCHDEDGATFYPSRNDEFVKQTSLLPSIKFCEEHKAANVSYLSFSDFDFQKEYATTSLRTMEELSQMKVPTGQYMTFAEQKILKSMVFDKPHKTLIKNSFACKHGWFHIDKLNDIGEWTFSDSRTKFWHIGFEKKILKRDSSYDFFYRIINKIGPEVGQRIKDIVNK